MPFTKFDMCQINSRQIFVQPDKLFLDCSELLGLLNFTVPVSPRV